MTQRAYKRWVLDDGSDVEDGGVMGRSCLTRDTGGSCLTRGMGGDITRGGGDRKGEGGKGDTDGIGVMVWGIITTLFFLIKKSVSL